MRIAILITFLISVFLFENCGSTSGGGSGFDLNTSASTSSGGIALHAGLITLNTATVTPGTAISASSSISGSTLGGGISCTWNLINSNGVAVVTPVIGVYSPSGSICTGSIVTPAAPGTYEITVTANDTYNDIATNYTTIINGSASAPVPTPTPKPPVATPTPGPVLDPPRPTPTPVKPPVGPCGRFIRADVKEMMIPCP